MDEMSREEAWKILAPYFQRRDIGEVDREAARRISESMDEADRTVVEAKRIREQYSGERLKLTPTKEGPIFCRKCHKLVYSLRLKGGLKIIDYKGKTVMDFGETTQMLGNSFGFKCQCGADIKIVT